MIENTRNEHEVDAPTKKELSYWPTGGGYLVFCVKREYHPDFESYYVVDRELVGVAEVEDRQAVRDVLRIYDYNPDIIDDLPVYEVE